MRILVVGVAGMLGHQVFARLSGRFAEVHGTVRDRRDSPLIEATPLLQSDHVHYGVDAASFEPVRRVADDVRPDVIVNCAGVIKQRKAADTIAHIEVNALLPHRLAVYAEGCGARVITFSTDCVFSGSRGNYADDDIADAIDVYGRAKYLGEVTRENTLTLRSSFIGRELRNRESLLEWVLARDGERVQGYANVFWSGVTTNHMAELLEWLVLEQAGLHGVFNLSTERVSKYDLLHWIREAFALDLEITRADAPVLDRSLRSDRFRAATGYAPPPLRTLVAEMAAAPVHSSLPREVGRT